jgi:hypothetical protein
MCVTEQMVRSILVTGWFQGIWCALYRCCGPVYFVSFEEGGALLKYEAVVGKAHIL